MPTITDPNKGVKTRGKKPRRTKPGRVPNESNKSPDGGKNVSARERFGNPDELRHRYERVRQKRGTMRSWTNILRMYERLPYKDEEGDLKGCFGQLRYKVDQALTTFVDFATERETWAKITTDEGDEEALTKLWSEHITAAFQKFCIKKWMKKAYEVMTGAKDMLLFSNGVLAWENEHDLYPKSVPTETVWPDKDAGQFADDWDCCFIEKRFKAVELFERVEDPEVAEANGWRRGPVMRVLKSSNDIFKDEKISNVFEEFRLGNLAADVQDFPIDVVVALVKEYHPTDGKKITKFVFIRQAVPSKQNRDGTVSGTNTGTEYLLKKKGFAKSMSEAVSVLNQTPARMYYENTSFAQLVYTTSKQYDVMMNRILEAVQDNMRVYLKSDNPEQMEKLQRMRHGNFQVLDPETDVVQERITRPIKDAADVLRMVMVDQNVGTGQYMVGEAAREGGNKTATQAEIDLQESTRISSAHLKLFNLFMTFAMMEIYRRFTSVVDSSDPEWKYVQRFRRYLNKRGVPGRAWDPENVCVESVISLGAGSPAAKLQGGRIILEALAQPARTPGERQAKRDIIASVVGIENTDAYLPAEGDLNVPEDSLIGLEGESLQNPVVDPANIPVHPDHLHMRHIPRHIGTMEALTGIAEQLFTNREGLNPDDEGVILATVTDILIGIDNIGAHTVAHIELAGAGGSDQVKEQLGGYKQALNDINKRQDRMEQVLGEVQQGRLQEARERNGTDPELAHKERMYALDEQHKARMLEFDYTKETMKAEQLRTQSAENARLKNQLDVEAAQAKAEAENIKTRSGITNERIKTIAQATGTNGSNGSNGGQT